MARPTENLMVGSHKYASKQWLDNYDVIFKRYYIVIKKGGDYSVVKCRKVTDNFSTYYDPDDGSPFNNNDIISIFETESEANEYTEKLYITGF